MGQRGDDASRGTRESARERQLEGVARIRDDQHVEEGKVRTWPRRGERARRNSQHRETEDSGRSRRRSVENRAASEARKEAQLDVWKHNGVEISWRRASRVMESKGRGGEGRGVRRGDLCKAALHQF